MTVMNELKLIANNETVQVSLLIYFFVKRQLLKLSLIVVTTKSLHLEQPQPDRPQHVLHPNTIEVKRKHAEAHNSHGQTQTQPISEL